VCDGGGWKAEGARESMLKKRKTIGIRAKIMGGAERINMIDYRSNTID
jgi:hypothetical protein